MLLLLDLVLAASAAAMAAAKLVAPFVSAMDLALPFLTRLEDRVLLLFSLAEPVVLLLRNKAQSAVAEAGSRKDRIMEVGDMISSWCWSPSGGSLSPRLSTPRCGSNATFMVTATYCVNE